MADYRNLRVWKDGHTLAVEAERVVETMRKASNRDLCDQLSRAARSIPTNIAEGSAHESPHQFARYLQYALGSTSELEEHVQMARDINAISYADFDGLMTRLVSERRQLQRFYELVRDRARAAKEATKTKQAKKTRERP